MGPRTSTGTGLPEHTHSCESRATRAALNPGEQRVGVRWLGSAQSDALGSSACGGHVPLVRDSLASTVPLIPPWYHFQPDWKDARPSLRPSIVAQERVTL